MGSGDAVEDGGRGEDRVRKKKNENQYVSGIWQNEKSKTTEAKASLLNWDFFLSNETHWYYIVIIALVSTLQHTLTFFSF